MDQDSVIKIIQEAMEIDPRVANYGYFSGGSFVLDSVRVFKWFESEKELIHHISQCDPVIYEIDAEEEKLFQKEVEAIFENSNLLSEQNLDRLNEVGKSFMSVDWWGEFDDLLQGNSELACEIRSSFRSDDGDSEAPITNEEMDEFVEYIHTYGV